MSMLYADYGNINLHQQYNLEVLVRVNCKKESDFAKVIMFRHLSDSYHLNARVGRVSERSENALK